MTSPDRFTPPRAFTQQSTSAMSGVTRKSVADQMNADLLSTLDELGLTWFDILLGGFTNVIEMIIGAINKLISDIVHMVTGATGGFVDLTGMLEETDSTAELALEEIEAARRQAAAATDLTRQAQRQSHVQIDLADVRTSAPLWEAQVPGSFSTFPWCQLGYYRTRIADNQITHGASSTAADHTHTFRVTTNFINPYATQPGDTVKIAMVRAPRDTVIHQISWLSNISSTKPPELYARLWHLDSSGTELTALTPVSGNLQDTLPSPTFEGKFRYVYELPEDVLVEESELLVFGIRGSTQTEFVGARVFTDAFHPGVALGAIGGAIELPRDQPLPDTLSVAAILPGPASTPYVCFEPPPADEMSYDKRSYADDFDRPDGYLGGRWRVTSTQGGEGIRIVNRQAAWGGTNPNNYGTSTATYFSPLATDETEGTVILGQIGNLATPSRLVFRSNGAVTRGLALDFNAAGVVLVRLTGRTTTEKLIESVVFLASGDTVRWKTTPTHCLVYINDVVAVDTPLDSSLVAYGPENRYFSIMTGRTEFGPGTAFESIEIKDQESDTSIEW